MSTVDLGALDDFPDSGVRRVDAAGRALAVVRFGDDLYVLGDTCSHAEVSLSEGEVDPDECTLECPKHGSAFDLRTGEALTLPAVRPVPSYAVRVDGGRVVVEVDDV